MSPRTAVWVAWCVWALTVVPAALSVVLYSFTPTSGGDFSSVVETISTTALALVALVFATVGALIASHRSENWIGWIMCADGLAIAALTFADAYVPMALAKPGGLPGTAWVAWTSQWAGAVAMGLTLAFLLLLFPDGRLPSRRWRPVVWLSVAAMVTLGVSFAFTPGPFEGFPKEVENPLGLDFFRESLLAYGGVGWPLILLSCVLSAASLIVRFRRARGEERQQIKWFVFAAMWLAVGFVSSSFTYESKGPLATAAQLLAISASIGLPIAVGIAVLRYRLYDIDVLINRTLVYGSLTATLVLFYVGGVVSLQYAFRVLTGGESQLAVVASTLAIAALFNPLRRRIQSFIDRRFYRRKYDARKTLEAFSAKLRDETDLDALSDDLVSVVRETMQPAHVSLWLRPDPPPRRSGGQNRPPSPTLRPSLRHL